LNRKIFMDRIDAAPTNPDVFLLQFLGMVRRLRGELKWKGSSSSARTFAESRKMIIERIRDSFRLDRAGNGHHHAARTKMAAPVPNKVIARDSVQTVFFAQFMATQNGTECLSGKQLVSKSLSIIRETREVLFRQFNGHLHRIVGKRRSPQNLSVNGQRLLKVFRKDRTCERGRLSSGSASRCGADGVDGVGDFSSAAPLRAFVQRFFDQSGKPKAVRRLIARPGENPDLEGHHMPLRQGHDGIFDAAG